ncbi:RNA polymerase sigma factor [Labilibacter marinus]|uniref:RNA polymerase sigma factor n=1 Tax=Labilibacter marinus TaxID=1477105 RepID=UPI00094F8EEE|nr:RNA polymerase sigma factor [Labilibacter marinus]
MVDQELTDIEIIELFNSEGKQQDAFRLIMSRYKERLYWHIRKIVVTHDDADDALQNCFIKIWQNLGGFQGNSALYTWLYRIATNEALTLLKKKKKVSQYSINDEDNNHGDALKSDPYFDGNDLQLKLQQAIATLPDKQRIIFNLKYFEEMKYQEISEITDTSIGSLKASYHHATKKIEAFLKENIE